MSQKLQAVLFDLDGTLIDTAPDFIRIIKLMCQQHNHPCPSDAAIREQVSAGARAMTRLMFGELATVSDTDETLMKYRQQFLDYYEQDICVDSGLFEGLDALLGQLEARDIPWGIVTNKPRYLAEQLLDKLSLTQRCSVLVCPDDVTNTKPDPEPMYLALNTLNQMTANDIRPSQCLYVGDHIRDIQAGRAAGMQTMIAKFGYLSVHDKETLDTWGADYVVDAPHDLAVFVLNHI